MTSAPKTIFVQTKLSCTPNKTKKDVKYYGVLKDKVRNLF